MRKKTLSPLLRERNIVYPIGNIVTPYYPKNQKKLHDSVLREPLTDLRGCVVPFGGWGCGAGR
jgi:hypothetical protein